MRDGWHGWPHDLSDYHRAQPETVACLTGHSHHKSCSGYVSQADSVSGGGEVRRGTKTQQKKTYRTTVCVKIYLPRAFNVSEEIWAHLGRCRPGLSRRTRDCTSADVQRGNKIKGYQRNPVIARRLTVSPASKRRHLFCVLISSRCCGLLSRCACSTRLAGGLGGLEGSLVASTALRWGSLVATRQWDVCKVISWRWHRLFSAALDS